MSNLVILCIHFMATVARLLGPGGVRSLVPKSGVKVIGFSQICRKNGLLPPQSMQQSMNFDKSSFSLPAALACELAARSSLLPSQWAN